MELVTFNSCETRQVHIKTFKSGIISLFEIHRYMGPLSYISLHPVTLILLNLTRN